MDTNLILMIFINTIVNFTVWLFSLLNTVIVAMQTVARWLIRKLCITPPTHKRFLFLFVNCFSADSLWWLFLRADTRVGSIQSEHVSQLSKLWLSKLEHSLLLHHFVLYSVITIQIWLQWHNSSIWPSSQRSWNLDVSCANCTISCNLCLLWCPQDHCSKVLFFLNTVQQQYSDWLHRVYK